MKDDDKEKSPPWAALAAMHLVIPLVWKEKGPKVIICMDSGLRQMAWPARQGHERIILEEWRW